MARWTNAFLLAAAFFLAMLAQPLAQANSFKWETSLKTAYERAQQEHKLVFVDVGSPWCVPCQYLEHKIFPDSSVQDFLNNSYVSAHLDYGSTDAVTIMQKWNARGIPCLMVLDADGKLKGKVSGYASTPSKFINLVEAMTNGFNR